MDINIHRVKNVRLGKITDEETTNGKRFAYRDIMVHDDDGRVLRLTLYADFRKELILRSDK